MKKIKVERRGRVCKCPHCKNPLSMYNHGDYCYIHQSKMSAQEKDASFLKSPSA